MDEAMIYEMCLITGCTKKQAIHLLNYNNYNLNSAVDYYYESVVPTNQPRSDYHDLLTLEEASTTSQYISRDSIDTKTNVEVNVFNRKVPRTDQEVDLISRPQKKARVIVDNEASVESVNTPIDRTVKRQELETHIDECLAANIEDAETMIIEDCPGCFMPKILRQPSVKIFSCDNSKCRKDYC